MKLYEQRTNLVNTHQEIVEDIQNALEYLSSPKFENGEDWVRTGEIQTLLIGMRNKLALSMDEVKNSER